MFDGGTIQRAVDWHVWLLHRFKAKVTKKWRSLYRRTKGSLYSKLNRNDESG